jgi:hypothetical protein
LHEGFTEINVERINIVEPDGKPRLVISNRARSIGPIYKEKPFGYPGGTRPASSSSTMKAPRNGGLTFADVAAPDGKYQASTSMSFDQFDQDQVVTLQYNDNNGLRRSGFTVGDRAEANIYDVVMARDSIMKMADTAQRMAALQKLMGPVNGVPMYAERVYVGRDRSKSAVVNLSDPQGRPAVAAVVDSTGTPSMLFLDEKGAVTARFSAAVSTRRNSSPYRSSFASPTPGTCNNSRRVGWPTPHHLQQHAITKNDVRRNVSLVGQLSPQHAQLVEQLPSRRR